jgi:hypothetical protein
VGGSGYNVAFLYMQSRMLKRLPRERVEVRHRHHRRRRGCVSIPMMRPAFRQPCAPLSLHHPPTAQAVARTLEEAKRACALVNTINVSLATLLVTDFDAACGYIVLGHPLGGAYSSRAPAATAYPHRDSLLLMAAISAIPTLLLLTVTPGDYAKAYEQTDEFLRYTHTHMPRLRGPSIVPCAVRLQ